MYIGESGNNVHGFFQKVKRINNISTMVDGNSTHDLQNFHSKGSYGDSGDAKDCMVAQVLIIVVWYQQTTLHLSNQYGGLLCQNSFVYRYLQRLMAGLTQHSKQQTRSY